MIGGGNAHHRCPVLVQGGQPDSAKAGDTYCGAVPAVFLHPERRGIYRSAGGRGGTVPTDPVSRLSPDAGHERLEREERRVERPAARWGCSNGEEREATTTRFGAPFPKAVRRYRPRPSVLPSFRPSVLPSCPPGAEFPPLKVPGLFALGPGLIFRPVVRFSLPRPPPSSPPRREWGRR